LYKSQGKYLKTKNLAQ